MTETVTCSGCGAVAYWIELQDRTWSWWCDHCGRTINAAPPTHVGLERAGAERPPGLEE